MQVVPLPPSTSALCKSYQLPACMCRLAEYNKYALLQTPRELEPGCELCRPNREMLQDAWKAGAL
jgi:hypothetical protein